MRCTSLKLCLFADRGVATGWYLLAAFAYFCCVLPGTCVFFSKIECVYIDDDDRIAKKKTKKKEKTLSLVFFYYYQCDREKVYLLDNKSPPW